MTPLTDGKKLQLLARREECDPAWRDQFVWVSYTVSCRCYRNWHCTPPLCPSHVLSRESSCEARRGESRLSSWIASWWRWPREWSIGGDGSRHRRWGCRCCWWCSCIGDFWVRDWGLYIFRDPPKKRIGDFVWGCFWHFSTGSMLVFFRIFINHH